MKKNILYLFIVLSLILSSYALANTPNSSELKRGDINGDGQINSADLTILAKYVANIISSFDDAEEKYENMTVTRVLIDDGKVYVDIDNFLSGSENQAAFYIVKDVDISQFLVGMKVDVTVTEENGEYIATFTPKETIVSGFVTKSINDGEDKIEVNGTEYVLDDASSYALQFNDYVVFEANGQKVDTEAQIKVLPTSATEVKNISTMQTTIDESSIVVINGEWKTRDDIEVGDVYTKIDLANTNINPSCPDEYYGEYYVVSRNRFTGSFDSLTKEYVGDDEKAYITISGKDYSANISDLVVFEGEENDEEVSIDSLMKKASNNKYLGKDVEVVLNYLNQVVIMNFGKVDYLDTGSFYAVTSNGVWHESTSSGTKKHIKLVGLDGVERETDTFASGVEVPAILDEDAVWQDKGDTVVPFAYVVFNSDNQIKEIKVLNSNNMEENDGEATVEPFTSKMVDEKINGHKVTSSTQILIATPVIKNKGEANECVTEINVSVKEGIDAIKGYEEGHIVYDATTIAQRVKYVLVSDDGVAASGDSEVTNISEDGIYAVTSNGIWSESTEKGSLKHISLVGTDGKEREIDTFAQGVAIPSILEEDSVWNVGISVSETIVPYVYVEFNNENQIKLIKVIDSSSLVEDDGKVCVEPFTIAMNNEKINNHTVNNSTIVIIANAIIDNEGKDTAKVSSVEITNKQGIEEAGKYETGYIVYDSTTSDNVVKYVLVSSTMASDDDSSTSEISEGIYAVVSNGVWSESTSNGTVKYIKLVGMDGKEREQDVIAKGVTIPTELDEDFIWQTGEDASDTVIPFVYVVFNSKNEIQEIQAIDDGLSINDGKLAVEAFSSEVVNENINGHEVTVATKVVSATPIISNKDERSEHVSGVKVISEEGIDAAIGNEVGFIVYDATTTDKKVQYILVSGNSESGYMFGVLNSVKTSVGRVIATIDNKEYSVSDDSLSYTEIRCLQDKVVVFKENNEEITFEDVSLDYTDVDDTNATIVTRVEVDGEDRAYEFSKAILAKAGTILDMSNDEAVALYNDVKFVVVDVLENANNQVEFESVEKVANGVKDIIFHRYDRILTTTINGDVVAFVLTSFKSNDTLVSGTFSDCNGHSDTITEEISPTCVETGLMITKCAICGIELSSEVIPATGHTWDEGVTEISSGDDIASTIRYTCINCGITKTERLAGETE